MDNINLLNIKQFFLGANTPTGFVSYFDQLSQYKKDWHGFLIKGGPGTGKSSLMKAILHEFKDISDDIEVIYCSSDYKSLDGIIFNDKKISIVDATAPHVLEPSFPGVFENTISICDCWDKFSLDRDNIVNLFNENLFYHKQTINLLNSAYGLIKSSYDIVAKNIHNSQLTNYINKLICEDFELVKENYNIYNFMGLERKRFLSAISVGEVIFYQDTINNVAEKIYVINDPYGVVSNNILCILREVFLKSNIDIITCYCSMFSGKKIDHILIPSLKVAFVTNNDYHSFAGKSFKVINCDEFFDHNSTSLKAQLDFNKDESNKIINKALMFIKESKDIHDELEKYYSKSMNFELVNKKIKETIDNIKFLLDKK